MPCECVARCWFLAYRLMQSYDTNGYLTKIQQIFWCAFNRVSNKFRKSDSKDPTREIELMSNKLYIEAESNYENINHFVLLLNYEIFLLLCQQNVILI